VKQSEFVNSKSWP